MPELSLNDRAVAVGLFLLAFHLATDVCALLPGHGDETLSFACGLTFAGVFRGLAIVVAFARIHAFAVNLFCFLRVRRARTCGHEHAGRRENAA